MHFKASDKVGYKPKSLIFANSKKIYELNYESEKLNDILKFKEPISGLPEFFKMNDDQTAAIVGSSQDCIYYNH